MAPVLPLHEFQLTSGANLPFEIVRIKNRGPASQCTAKTVSPHRHGHYEVLYLTGGVGLHIIDYKPMKIETPCVFFVSPGQVHFWELEIPLDGWAMLFTDEFLVLPGGDRTLVHELSFFHGVAEHPVANLKRGDLPDVEHMLHSMDEEYRGQEVGRESVIRAQLHILLVRLQRLHRQACSAVAPASTLVHQFKKMVTDCFLESRAVGDYARVLGVSKAHLQDVVKSATGITPGQIIRQAVAVEAQRLLVHTDLTTAEVGYELSFDDPSYFSRFFRREVGVSPNQFRTKIRKQYQHSKAPA